MRAIVSPAKSLNTALEHAHPATSQPRFLAEADQLVQQMRAYDPAGLAKLMHLSDPLAALNVARFEQWQADHTDPSLLPAVFAFNGDVYKGLEVQSLSIDHVQAVNTRIRILSGLYGLLRPLDAFRPYRLEMGTKIQVQSAASLAGFWRPKVTAELNAELDGAPLVNLASQEYADAVDFKQIQSPIITPVFQDWKNGQFKIISFYAKRARGLMARFIALHAPQAEPDLFEFNLGGYQYNADLSKPNKPVFTRNPDA